MHFQLIIALQWGFADRARLLIEHGVDINSPDNNYYPTYTVGYTPYQAALMRGMPDIAELIAAKGGDTTPLGEFEQFQSACMRGDLEMALELAPEYLGVDPAKDHELLCRAAGNGNVKAVQTMLAVGFELTSLDGHTPLHMAAFRGHKDVIRILIDAGADTRLRDPVYNTPPFVHAMHNFQHETVALLLDHPMDVFAAAAMGKTDQLEAAFERDPDLVNARFQTVRTGSQESYANDWTTPLWFAAMNGRMDVVKFLIQHDADPTISDPMGKTISDYARDAGQDAIAELLGQ
jgi:ankyrin repeat protein